MLMVVMMFDPLANQDQDGYEAARVLLMPITIKPKRKPTAVNAITAEANAIMWRYISLIVAQTTCACMTRENSTAIRRSKAMTSAAIELAYDEAGTLE